MRLFDDREVRNQRASMVKRQDRASYRIETSLFLIRIQQLHAPTPTPRVPQLTHVTLSTSGVGFRSHYALKPHQWVVMECAIPTESDRILHCQARVIYSVPMEDGTYNCGLRFEWMNAEDNDRLRRYIQAEQRAYLRQRLDEQGF